VIKTVNNIETVHCATMSVFEFELERDIPRGRLFSCFEELKLIQINTCGSQKRLKLDFEARYNRLQDTGGNIKSVPSIGSVSSIARIWGQSDGV
jgi:hypothetical protein